MVQEIIKGVHTPEKRREAMTEKKGRTYGACEGPACHSDHLCILMEKGLTEEVRRRSSHPAFACGNCEARANEAKDLCNPQPL
jgi:hypothetical protein